uniref:DUF1985 domain-containing protein n=1 Tax=Lactuca sativa TaxID=4236 RepID=A0A9R1X1Q6_LACSA|nr:hypothetical protein LSAT_V11C700379510 [Lactuca sativa]
MQIPHGDPLLVHLMMLHEDEDTVMLIQLVFMLKGLHGRDVKTGIPVAVYKVADNIDDWNMFAWGTYLRTNISRLMRGMFKKIEEFRLFKQANPESKKAHKYTIPDFMLSFKDEDTVMLIQLVFMLKGLHGRDVKTGIPVAVYKVADNIDDWNMFAWGTYLRTNISRLMRGMFKKIEEFRLFKQANPESKKAHKYTIPDFMLSFKDEDTVMLIQLVFMLKGLHGRDVKTGIPVAVYKVADNIDDWNMFAWGTYLRTNISRLMRGMFKKIEEFRLFKQANPESKKAHKYTIPDFMLSFKVNF